MCDVKLLHFQNLSQWYIFLCNDIDKLLQIKMEGIEREKGELFNSSSNYMYK
jgi:hypothetical protein